MNVSAICDLNTVSKVKFATIIVDIQANFSVHIKDSVVYPIINRVKLVNASAPFSITGKFDADGLVKAGNLGVGLVMEST